MTEELALKRLKLMSERTSLQNRESQIYNEMYTTDSTGLDTLLRERRVNLRRQCAIIDELMELNLTHEVREREGE